MKILKILTSILLLIIGVIIFKITVYKPHFKSENNEVINVDLLSQLNYLQTEIHNHGADKMQEIFPEGKVFSLSLYGLTWIDFASSLNSNSGRYKRAVVEINYVDSVLNENSTKQQFESAIPNLPLGAFYTGWSTYVLGRKIKLLGKNNVHENDIERFKFNCNQIENAIINNKFNYLESYTSQVWPADNLLCMASLNLYDEIFSQKYKNAIGNWIINCKQYLDQNGLIPHKMNENGQQISENAHGNSHSLMLIFLNEIDSTFAKQQFSIYKQQFLDIRLGLYGIREYPKGVNKEGDIDSGPVIWDIGGAASIVGIRTMNVFNEKNVAISLRNSVETFGFSNIKNEQKYYLLKEMLMADLFIAWVNVLDKSPELSLDENSSFHSKMYLILLTYLALVALIFYLMYIKM